MEALEPRVAVQPGDLSVADTLRKAVVGVELDFGRNEDTHFKSRPHLISRQLVRACVLRAQEYPEEEIQAAVQQARRLTEKHCRKLSRLAQHEINLMSAYYDLAEKDEIFEVNRELRRQSIIGTLDIAIERGRNGGPGDKKAWRGFASEVALIAWLGRIGRDWDALHAPVHHDKREARPEQNYDVVASFPDDKVKSTNLTAAKIQVKTDSNEQPSHNYSPGIVTIDFTELSVHPFRFASILSLQIRGIATDHELSIMDKASVELLEQLPTSGLAKAA